MTLPAEVEALLIEAPVVNDDALGALAKAAKELVTAKAKIAFYEAKLAAAKAECKVLEEQTLPDAMDAANVSTFTTTDGHSISIKSIVAGSIPKVRMADAVAWLRENGHAGLIKREVTVAFARGQDEIGAKAVAALNALGVEVVQKESVHPSTLGAWAREMTENGHEFPRDLLGIYVGRRAEVK